MMMIPGKIVKRRFVKFVPVSQKWSVSLAVRLMGKSDLLRLFIQMDLLVEREMSKKSPFNLTVQNKIHSVFDKITWPIEIDKEVSR